MKVATEADVEMVAEAIRNAFADRVGRGKEWKALPPATKEAYRKEARAAFAAMGYRVTK